MQKVNYDIVTSIIFIIISIITILETRGLSKISYIFPRTIGVIFLLLSFMYLILSIIKRDNKKLFGNIDKQKVLIMSIGMIGYFISISLFGFLIASILYIGLITWYLQKDQKEKSHKSKILRAVLCSIIVSVSFFILFQYVFLVPLPTGLLG
ncbi:hypothetical protein GCM10011409_35170 [Lentibacillus populi]|uniref:DUF1468 domain-containing protein n=1 Tax=Lentibacillus populi TaxID=1827502 RepID=A0A9W5U0L1_9BACI|nr:tripartite tricarboxylate transporter TctB family protein [Lentibacillus populi]GGB54528.1 hypothetical protein GCM10011409_35170 [Lentibacillus populi]